MEKMKPVKVPLQKPGLTRHFATVPRADGMTRGSAEGQGCARSAANTWQGQNPSGGADAPPNTAIVHVRTMCSCQKLRLVSLHHLTTAALRTTKGYVYHSAIAFLCEVVRRFYKIPLAQSIICH